MPPNQLVSALHFVWTALADFPEKAIAGGLAVSMWGYPRSTRDIDLALRTPVPELSQKPGAALRSAGLSEKRSGVSKLSERIQVQQWKYEIPETFIEVDVDLLLGDSPYFVQAVSHSPAVTLPGIDSTMRVLACEDLILFKAIAGRLIDLADIRELIDRNRTTLDLCYLKKWAAELGIGSTIQTYLEDSSF